MSSLPPELRWPCWVVRDLPCSLLAGVQVAVVPLCRGTASMAAVGWCLAWLKGSHNRSWRRYRLPKAVAILWRLSAGPVVVYDNMSFIRSKLLWDLKCPESAAVVVHELQVLKDASWSDILALNLPDTCVHALHRKPRRRFGLHALNVPLTSTSTLACSSVQQRCPPEHAKPAVSK